MHNLIEIFHIKDKRSYADFCEKHSIPDDESKLWNYTMLQKAAISTCIVKNTYLLEKVMDAKKKECINLYFSKFMTFNFQLNSIW